MFSIKAVVIRLLIYVVVVCGYLCSTNYLLCGIMNGLI